MFNEVESQAPDQLLVPHGSQDGADLSVPMGGSFGTVPCFFWLFLDCAACAMKLSKCRGRVKKAKKN